MSVGDYIPVQQRGDINRNVFILNANRAMYEKGILLQDGGRSIDLAPNTLLAKRASSQKWVPFEDEAATNGGAIPQGIYTGQTILAADIVAGDVSDLVILVRGFPVEFDEGLIVIENAKTLETVITVGTTDLRTVRDHLRRIGLIPRLTIQSVDGEN